jgi:hypothetical protein
MIAELKVGPQTLSDGAVSTARATKDATVATQDGHGRYLETAYRGNTFFLCNTQAVAFQAGVATTSVTGLVLSNPSTNTKNFALLQVAYQQVATTVGAVTLSYYTGAIATQTTVVTVGSTFVGKGGSSSATGSASCVFANAGIPIMPIYSNVNSSVTSQLGVPIIIDLGGSIVLSPGSAISVAATAGTSGISAFFWEELPL